MTVPSTPRAPFLGAYAMAPGAPEEARAFYAALAELPLGGLEVPVPPQGADGEQLGWDTGVHPDWDLLATCIPTVMGRLGEGPAYGLASADDDARAQALADVRHAADQAVRLADRDGCRRVAAIQVHSAPGPRHGSPEALSRSLAEILTWDLAGAQVLLEHCDALVPGQAAAKGFLTLADEVGAIGNVLGGSGGATDGAGALGVSINWGRAAIEGRSARTPVEHVSTAAEAGLLRAVVLSGATDADTAWGPAWGDAHIPPRGDDDALAASAASLLDAEAVRTTLAAAGPGCLVAVKVSVRPTDADVATRLAVARAALALAVP